MANARALLAFIALAYLLTWALLGPFFYLFNSVYGGDVAKMPGWMWTLAPLAFIGGWGPSVAALIVAPLAGGRAALGKLLKSLTIWRAHVGWYVAIFALPPLLTAASVFIVDRTGATLARLDWTALLANIPLAYALALPFGPLGEELGWRGLHCRDFCRRPARRASFSEPCGRSGMSR